MFSFRYHCFKILNRLKLHSLDETVLFLVYVAKQRKTYNIALRKITSLSNCCMAGYGASIIAIFKYINRNLELNASTFVLCVSLFTESGRNKNGHEINRIHAFKSFYNASTA